MVNASLVVAVKVFLDVINIKSVDFEKSRLPSIEWWVGLIQSVEVFKKKKSLRSPGEEGILPPDCNMETLPVFPDCRAALQISDFPAPTIS